MPDERRRPRRMGHEALGEFSTVEKIILPLMQMIERDSACREIEPSRAQSGLDADDAIDPRRDGGALGNAEQPEASVPKVEQMIHHRLHSGRAIERDGV